MFKKVWTGLVLVIVLVVVVGFMLPSKFEVSRSISINAKPEQVFQHIVHLKKWKDWGVWFERDPKMTIKYLGDDGAIGSQSIWQSESQGNGEMEILEIKPNHLMRYELRFPDMGMNSIGELILAENNGVTLVTWKDSGDMGYDLMGRYFILFLDGMIGPDFEAGLSNLKALSEK